LKYRVENFIFYFSFIFILKCLKGIYANCDPTEDGYRIEVNTQWIDTTQRSVAMALGIQNSSIIDIQVKQLGGGFGGKTTRTNFAAAAAALGAYHTHKPVKVAMDLNDCMVLFNFLNT
jgi:xanthine dehydrogenase molybdopterin-binding subunit B